MARLKVFRAHMGFFESVVAAPSQKAALEAWGVRQDLFHEGLAGVTDDPEAAKAALAHPGVPLRRAEGSKDPFAADAPPPAAPKSRSRSKAAPPDRSVLDKAERALAKAEAEHEQESQALEREARELEARREDLEARWRERLGELEDAVAKARRAYRRAGGEG